MTLGTLLSQILDHTVLCTDERQTNTIELIRSFMLRNNRLGGALALIDTVTCTKRGLHNNLMCSSLNKLLSVCD